MASKIFIGIAAGLVPVSLAACGGGTVQQHGPAAPSWSLTDKPQALGAPAGGTAGQAPQSPYEYRGGRDSVTGAAGTIEGSRSEAGATPKRTHIPSGPRTVEVHKGDTLHGLSLTHHVSVNALMAANNLPDAKIVPGQMLLLPPER